jgi:hypothetical protein
MKKLTILLRFIGVVQLILGFAFLFAPAAFTAWMGLSATHADINYLFGMLAARFIAYGIGMFVVACEPIKNAFWINNMILIQLIDLTVGIIYTSSGILSLTASAFPMFNAALFAGLLFLWKPKVKN